MNMLPCPISPLVHAMLGGREGGIQLFDRSEGSHLECHVLSRNRKWAGVREGIADLEGRVFGASTSLVVYL